MRLTGADVVEFLDALVDTAAANQRELDELDAVAADGDHGGTFLLGWRTVAAGIDRSSDRTPTAVLVKAAADFASVGGSIGPLWGTALLRAGRTLDGAETITATLLAEAVRAGVGGVADRGGAQVGDKTMLDVLAPAADALSAAIADGREAKAVREALEAARTGLLRTAQLPAQRGRARRLSDRSIGHLDPGAASSYLVWATAAACADPAVTITLPEGAAG